MAGLSSHTSYRLRLPASWERYLHYSIPSPALVSVNIVSDSVSVLRPSLIILPDFLATGVVILISIAIAAGIVFLMALIGILWTLFSRRDDKMNKFEAVDGADDDDDDDSGHHRPSSLLEHINAATRTTILGATSPFTAEKEAEKVVREGPPDQDPFGADGSNYVRAETPSDAVGGTMAGEEETSRPAHARYSFDGTGEGELALSAGLAVEVLDDRDPAYVFLHCPSHCSITFGTYRWWYARDTRTGREGVVPAAYLY